VPDFVSDTRILWSKDRTAVVSDGDKDGDPAAVFAGVGGVVYEDQAKRLGLIGPGGGLTAKGRDLGYLSTDTVPERPAGVARGQTEAPAPAPAVPAPRVGGDRPSS
jgi:hypothetical protein